MTAEELAKKIVAFTYENMQPDLTAGFYSGRPTVMTLSANALLDFLIKEGVSTYKSQKEGYRAHVATAKAED